MEARPGGLAAGALAGRRGGAGDVRRRRCGVGGAEDLFLGPAFEQREELIPLDRLALSEDLGDRRRAPRGAPRAALGALVRGLDDAADLVVDSRAISSE